MLFRLEYPAKQPGAPFRSFTVAIHSARNIAQDFQCDLYLLSAFRYLINIIWFRSLRRHRQELRLVVLGSGPRWRRSAFERDQGCQQGQGRVVTDGIVGYRGDDNAVERSRVDPAGAQATRSTRLLVEFVAKRAPRQGTSSRDGQQDLRMGCSVTAEGSDVGDGAHRNGRSSC
jgi:hypothetical protein